MATTLATTSEGCADSEPRAEQAEDGAIRRDGAPAQLPDAASEVDATAAPLPSCEKYCETVSESCTGSNAQYASTAECLRFCGYFPLGKNGETDTDTVACRQYYAGSPSMTDAVTYCIAAGPFGGGICGDRCTVFCQLTSAVCVGDGASTLPAYPSQPECATACAGFELRDAGVDGGGEGPGGPDGGDTLNCRFQALREALVDASACANVGANSATCRD